MKVLIEEYGRGYEMLREAIEGLSEEELRFKPNADAWNIHSILVHVTDSEILSTHRLKKVLAEDEPLLISFDQNAWTNNLAYEQLDREQHLLLFQLLRSSMLPILNNLTDQQYNRAGVYEDAGRFTFSQLLEYRVQHVRDHLAQIKRVREAYRLAQKESNSKSDWKAIEVYINDLQRYPLEKLRRIPEPGVWSLAQMYKHVIEVADEYLDSVEACAAADVERPLGKTEGGERLFKNGGFPPVKIKLPDFLNTPPSNADTKEELTAGLNQVMLRMTEWEGKVDGVNPNYKVEHGGFGWLNAREWFALVGMHFRHHLRQKVELEKSHGL